MSQPPRLWLSLPFLLALGAILAAAQSAQRPDASNHVVVISLDGFKASALADPAIPLPTLRRLAKAGATARAMRPVNPTVTWANHTAIITGDTPARHGVIYNGLLVRDPGMPPRVEPWRDKKDMVRVPTLYDLAHAAGRTTAQVDWVAIWNAPTVTWEFRERPDPKGAIAREMIAAGALTEEDVDTFTSKNIVLRDAVWTQAAAHIIRAHKPNLMMFHLLTLDSTQHRYGPGTLAAQAVMAHLDAQVAEIIRAVEQAGLGPRTTYVIVSDHGFKTVKRQINPNVALARAGLVTLTDGKVTKADTWVMPEGGTAFAYVTSPDPSGGMLARMKQALAGIEGIETIVEPSGYAAYGLPMPGASDQIGELFLTAKDGYAFTAAVSGEAVVNDAPEGSLGAHGYVNTDPELGAIFIASGRGIKPGVTLDSVSNLDLAPTMARLLGIAMPGTDGKVIAEILSVR
ncbi:MAG: ectonucleotide pyrophosphatase/phosphodiesterase [Acidobacteriota bacterium]